jgi:hypothetical protein
LRNSTVSADKDLDDIQNSLDLYSNILVNAEDNGLFFEGNSGEYDKLKECLREIRKSIEATPPNKIDAFDRLLDFPKIMNLAERKRGLWWRLNHGFAIFEWIYLTASPFALWYVFVPLFSIISSLKLTNATFWGGLGGIVQGYYWLWQNVSDKFFRSYWWFWVLSLPIGGAIFGGMAYLLLSGGVVSATTGTLNENAAVFFAALAGFTWKDFVGLIGNLWSQVKTKGSNP